MRTPLVAVVAVLLAVLASASVKNGKRVYQYDGHGPFYGGHSVSPAGASGGGRQSATNWIRSVTGSQGDARALLEAYQDPSFADVALHGSLRDHIAILSKTLAVLVLRDGEYQDRLALLGRFERMLKSSRRAELFARAYPWNRVETVWDFFIGLNVTNRHQSLAAFKLIPSGSLKAYEMPLMERTFLLLSLHRYTDRNADVPASFIDDVMYFYVRVFFRKDLMRLREVNIRLAPDTALLFAEMIQSACSRRIRTDKVYFAQYLREHDPEFVKAIAYEVDAIAGRSGRMCMDAITGTTIEYDRVKDFPRWTLPNRAHLSHPPELMNGWDVVATKDSVVIKPDPDKQASDRDYRNLRLKMALSKDGQSLSVTASGRFLVFKLSDPVANTFDSSGAEESGDTDTSNTVDSRGSTDDAGDATDTFRIPSNPFASTVSNSDPSSSSKVEKWIKVVKRKFVCGMSGKVCTFPVKRGDLVIAMFAPDLRVTELTLEESDAIIYAWHGSKREILLQIAATMTSKQLYSLVLVE